MQDHVDAIFKVIKVGKKMKPILLDQIMNLIIYKLQNIYVIILLNLKNLTLIIENLLSLLMIEKDMI